MLRNNKKRIILISIIILIIIFIFSNVGLSSGDVDDYLPFIHSPEIPIIIEPVVTIIRRGPDDLNDTIQEEEEESPPVLFLNYENLQETYHLISFNDYKVPLSALINMTEGDCFN